MKNTFRNSSYYACVFAFVFSIMFPLAADASMRDDGERFSRRGSEYSTKIRALDNERVEELPIPILFGVTLKQIFPNFGDPRDDGDRTHQGLDIMAPKGAPIVSPTEAVVIRTGEGESSGKTVTTANPGGETFVYMHLSDILVTAGTVLHEGDLIGLVGNTGNASGGLAHLHFEVRGEGRVAMDPYPRISREFSLEEKVDFLAKAMGHVDDTDEFATFVATTYQAELRKAKTAGYDLPEAVDDELKAIPVPVMSTSYATASGDLSLGSKGPLVVAVQELLIAKDLGPAAKALATVGATGYFGTITQNAVIEYQTTYGIAPAVGYYGPKTRAHMLAQ